MKTLYVSPAGDDANPGTQEQPFATIGRARDAVREINRNMTGDIVVILGGGTYSISEPIVFDQRDSATGGHTIVYRSADGQAGGHQRRPGHSAAGKRTPADSGKRPPTWPTSASCTWTACGPCGPGAKRCQAPNCTAQTATQTTAVEMADWRNPERHRVLLLRRLVPHAVQGPEHPAAGRPRDRHACCSRTSPTPARRKACRWHYPATSKMPWSFSTSLASGISTGLQRPCTTSPFRART